MPIVDLIDPGFLTQSHQVSTYLEVLENDIVIGTIEDGVDGSVSLDSGAGARGRLSLNIVGTEELIPTSPTDLLAPYGNEIRVYRGIQFWDHTELVCLGVFRIDHTTVPDDGTNRTIAIDGLDRSGRFIDASFITAGQIDAGTQAEDAILQVLTDIWGDLPYQFESTNAALPKVIWVEGEDRWAFAQGIATAIGGDLYFNKDGVLILEPVPTVTSDQPAAFFEEANDDDDNNSALLSATRDMDRAGKYNHVIVTGENTSLDDSAPPPRGEAIDDENPNSPTYYYGKFGPKPLFFNSSFISTNDQADACAHGILAQVMGAPDVLDFAGLVHPGLTPSDVVHVKREAIGVDEAHVLDTVTIPLAATESMTCRTRVTTVL